MQNPVFVQRNTLREHFLMLQGEVSIEHFASLQGVKRRSKTSRTKVWAAEHILPICVRDVIIFFTSRTLSLAVGRIWHSDVRDDFHLPVSISPSSPLEAAVYVVSEFPGRLRTSFFLKSPTQAREGHIRLNNMYVVWRCFKRLRTRSLQKQFSAPASPTSRIRKGIVTWTECGSG